ncbi:unnamed protein product (macronuclear) [Paramecium tetraurelia]|uniref:Autophagy-related protein 2 n=1 Tax=Paramecium tetraurelia TaxID=5888 RepID=A0C6C1_PARTE|nr:uncharacterized protein GSPATT00035467001 [Paramecium tetraurelia]CAK66338.1 unnamed protein product [Paramecium tetraurelia]|eukprot:XP_001433735.1 hypothetical protein (macronuclear) [Paramecium tetraurelia strain d4-2]
MGNFFNEEIKKDQFTQMGLKNLTLKVSSLNSHMAPNIPFVLESGSISLLKLDLHKLTCLIEEVEITLNFKTIEQYRLFVQTYTKEKMTADKLQKIKDEIIKVYKVKSETSNNVNQNAWNIIRQFLQKITFTVNKLVLHIVEPIYKDKLSLAINQISMRVRKLQEEKDQMVSTVIIGGCSVHINEPDQLFDPNNFQRESCIFSLQQQYTNKYDQHVVIHLKTELKERLKFNSTLCIRLMQMNFNYKQFQIAIRVIMSILEHNKLIQSQDKTIIESIKQETPQFQFTWCESKVYYDYCDKYGEVRVDDVDQKSLSDEATVEFNDDLEEALEKSQFNEEEGNEQMEESQIEGFNQSILYQSNLGDLNQSTLKQSMFSVSVFKELINDEDDKQGLEELDEGQLIFKLKIQKIRVRLSRHNIIDKWNVESSKKTNYYELEIDQLNWLMNKEVAQQQVTTIKQTKIEIPIIQLFHYEYFNIFSGKIVEDLSSEEESGQDIFQSINDGFSNNTQTMESQIFHSCYNLSQSDVEEKITKKKNEFIKEQGNYYYKKKCLLQLYDGCKESSLVGAKQQPQLITKVDNQFIYQNDKIISQGNGLQIQMHHLNHSHAISIKQIDINLNIDEILEFKEIFQINHEKKQIKSIPNLNLITIHRIQFDVQIQESDYAEFYYLQQIINNDPNSSSVMHQQQKMSFFTFDIIDLQVQQSSSGFITFNSIKCLMKEYDRIKQVFHDETIAEIGAQEQGQILIRPIIKLMDTKEVRVAIPKLQVFINLSYMEYVKTLFMLIKDFQKRLRQSNTNKQENKQIVRLLFDEIIVKINLDQSTNPHQARFILHASKFAAQIKGQDEVMLTLYNCLIIDTNWNCKRLKQDIPIYGSPNNTKTDQPFQVLHFRNEKYQANQVLFYKQERFNREGFKTLVQNETIKSQPEMAFQYTAIKLKTSQYLNPDCLDVLNGNTNLLIIKINKNKKIDIQYQHGIIQVDEQWIETITNIQDLAKKWEQTLVPQKNKLPQKNSIPNFTFSVSNIWLNYLPTYRRSTLLKQYLMKKEPIKSIIAIQPEQLYYSWIRVLIRIKSATVSSDLQAHLSSAQIYVKSTSKDIKHANLSFLNPILLVPPQIGLFYENRKFSDGFQIDKDEQGLLRLLCFQKLFKIKGITFSGNLINVGQINGNLKKDSIISLWDIASMTIEKIKKIIPEQQNENQIYVLQDGHLYTPTQNMNIFDDDDTELPAIENTPNKKQFEIVLKSIDVKLTVGQHFPPEYFSDTNPINPEYAQQNQEQYYLEHSNLLHLEEFPQMNDQSCDYIHFSLKELKLKCCGPSQREINQFYLTLLNFQLADEIKNSKFSKLIGKEPQLEDTNFAEFFYSIDKPNNSINLEAKFAPFRVCVSGEALEFMLETVNSPEQLNPKVDLLSKLNVGNDKESIIEFCVQEGYQVTFSRISELKKSMKVNFLNIERIYCYITFDGNGVKLDGKLKGLVRLASYDNLLIFLKRAQINNLIFEKDRDFIKFLFDQYYNLLRNDSQLIQNLITSFKAFQNITNIVSGIQTMFTTIIKQGLVTGVCSGSIPLAKALGDEIVYLTKKPIEVCSTMTEGIGLKIASVVFSPIERALDQFSTLTTSDRIPREFLKKYNVEQTNA